MDDWLMDRVMPGVLVALVVVFLVWVSVAVVADSRARAEAPCEAFRNYTIEYMPARCAAYFYR